MPYLKTCLLLLCLLSTATLWASININLANEAELSTLKGIGPSKAQAIVAHRLQHGLFQKTEDIQKVKGIGPILYQRIKDSIHTDKHSQTPPFRPRTVQPQPALKSTNPVMTIPRSR